MLLVRHVFEEESRTRKRCGKVNEWYSIFIEPLKKKNTKASERETCCILLTIPFQPLDQNFLSQIYRPYLFEMSRANYAGPYTCVVYLLNNPLWFNLIKRQVVDVTLPSDSLCN